MLRWLAILVVIVGCDEPGYEFDRFPIAVSMDPGVPVIYASADDGDPMPLALDTGSPLTLLDTTGADDTTRLRAKLTLHAVDELDNTIPRARFFSIKMLSSRVAGIGPGIGDPSTASFPSGGVLGGDVMSQVAVRFDLSHSQINLFLDVAGDDRDHTKNCQSVFRTPARGGGSYQLGDDTVDLPATRLVVGACFAQDLSGNPPPYASTVMLVATGIEPTLLTQSAVARIFPRLLPVLDADINRPWFVPGSRVPTLVMPLDLNQAILAPSDPNEPRVMHVAVVGSEKDNRSPCEELWIQRQMTVGCNGDCTACRESPTQPTDCRATATVQIETSWRENMDESPSLLLYVVRDTDPLIQGIRNELRPSTAEIDGILGANLLKTMRFTADYPNSRIIAQCADTQPVGVQCIASPSLLSSSDVQQELAHCYP